MLGRARRICGVSPPHVKEYRFKCVYFYADLPLTVPVGLWYTFHIQNRNAITEKRNRVFDRTENCRLVQGSPVSLDSSGLPAAELKTPLGK